MTELSTLARPYAKAAFQYAKQSDDIQAWSKALALLAALIKDRQLVNFISHPATTELQAFNFIVDLMGNEVNDARKNFVHLLAQNDRLLSAGEIVELFEQYVSDLNKTVDVEVEIVFPLSDALQAKLKKSLEWRLQRSVNLNFKTDESLIGGAIIRAGDFVIDGSVRSQLQKLHEVMLG